MKTYLATTVPLWILLAVLVWLVNRQEVQIDRLQQTACGVFAGRNQTADMWNDADYKRDIEACYRWLGREEKGTK